MHGESLHPRRRPPLSARGDNRSLTAALVAAVNYDGDPAVAGPDWSVHQAATLVEAADAHRIAPALWRLASVTGAPSAVVDPLRSLYDDQMIRHLTVEADLGWAAGMLDRAGVPWVAIKGPVLSDVLWPRPDMRQYYDLDLLVDRHHFETVIMTLIEGGAQLIDRNWPLIRQQMRAELTLILPYGTSLDLHWHVLNDRDLRRSMYFDAGPLLARAKPVSIGTLVAPTLDPVDTLLTVALHAAHSGATRLLWLKDTERAAAAIVDWAEVGRRATSTGLNLALTTVVRKAWRVLGTQQQTTGWSLATGVVPALAGLIDHVIPVVRAGGHGRSGQLLYRSLRRSAWQTGAAAVGELGRAPVVWPDRQGNPLHADVPDAGARTAYFREVERTTQPS